MSEELIFHYCQNVRGAGICILNDVAVQRKKTAILKLIQEHTEHTNYPLSMHGGFRVAHL